MGQKKYISAVLAAYHRNIKVLTRQRQMLLAPIVGPLIILIMTSIIMGSNGDRWPIALINESGSGLSEAVEKSIQDIHSNITPYFTVIETDLKEARKMIRAGRLHMLIRIPKDFSQTGSIYTETFNINSDMTKNVRLRLEHAVLDEMNTFGKIRVKPVLITDKPADVWRQAFLGGSSVLLALLIGTTILAANLFSFDWENRTQKEILLTPTHVSAMGLGIILSSITVSVLSSIPTLLVATLVFKLRIHMVNLFTVYLSILPILVGCAGVGILVGQWLKQYRLVQPIIIVTSMATFFSGGGFAGVNVLPPTAHTFAKIWLFSRIFEWYNPIIHDFKNNLTASQYVLSFIAGCVGLALTFFAYYRFMRGRTNAGQ